MTKPHLYLLGLVSCCLVAASACNGGTGNIDTGLGGSSGAAGAGSAAGGTMTTSGAAGDPGTSTGAAGTPATSGTSGSTGTTSGSAGDNGTSGTAGAGMSTGTAGAGMSTGTAGAGMSTGTAGATGAGGTGVVATKPSGSSTGCGMAPAGADSESKFSLKNIHITATLDPVYLAGGDVYKNQKLPNGGYDYQYRPYSVRLPKNYDPSKPYAVTFGGGGCGGSASSFASGPGGGLQSDSTQSTLQIGLSYLAGCFDDGGPQIDARSDTPEEPYFRAVLADVESKYCVDKGRVFVEGYSSGGWEAFTLGCAAADVIRGIGTDEGGMRVHRPPCKGPVAAFLVAGEADTVNAIGPLAKIDTGEDSFGSAPGRDDLLLRNGCVSSNYVFTYMDQIGSAPHMQYSNATYSACYQFTGCPAAYPVVWCPLPGAGHNNSSIGKTNYTDGIWGLLGSLPTP